MSANRGKLAEGKAKAFLQTMSEQTSLVYHRLPDAHAGSMVSTLCDFIVHYAGLTLLEVKEVNHEYRLPYGNFKQENASRMRLWEYSGAETLIAIYFKPLKKWRMTKLERFEPRSLCTPTGKPQGSWDLRDLELVDINHMKSFL